MKTHAKSGILALVVAVPAFITGRIILPPSPDMHPTASQVPFLMGMSVIESLALGFGVAFLVFGWKMVKDAPAKRKKLAVWTYLAVGWLLCNWWLHDNLHAHNGMDIGGLIRIEYAFHVTLIVAGVIVSRWFLASLADMKATAAPSSAPKA
jgi:hypothetical protein